MTLLNYRKLLLAFLALSVIEPVFADDFGELAKRCAPEVSEDTLRALVRTESSFNPYAIGIVGGGSRQPKAFHEAMAVIAQLELERKKTTRSVWHKLIKRIFPSSASMQPGRWMPVPT